MALGIGTSSTTKVVLDLIGRDSASSSFRKVAGSADTLASRVTKAGSAMNRVGGTLTKTLTLPILGIGAASLKTAVDYQKSMTLLQTAGGETAKKMAVLSSGVKKAAVDTGTSLNSTADAMYTVAKAGSKKWSAVDQLKVLTAALQGAKAEGADTATSVSALTSVMQGYGYSAKQAVAAENQIIRASGLSKTTFQDFAGSLANVVPLASSLKISFSQVGGAIATMTQHGETADRATQNLSNLITNLAGQNNVASQAMQQLGINTVKLQKSLSKNGLTGTLQVVENAIAKNSKGGMVVVSAFKQAQQATHDLHVELANMTGPLQANSKAFAAGKMGYKDYYTFVKSLGGQQYEMGKQFITTTAAAKGFNTQLSSGNSDVRTTATELQKLLGGVTGMRTALMLGGTSAKGFASNVKQVGAAANATSKNVVGWNKTQQTASQQWAEAKVKLSALGETFGEKLLPVVTKLGTGIGHLVDDFDHMSSSSKKVVTVGLLVGAGLGPALSVVGRLTQGFGLLWKAGAASSTFVAGLRQVQISEEAMGSGAYGAGNKVGTLMANLRSGSPVVSGFASAIGGVGLGFAIGEMTKNASAGAKTIGLLASAASGAALGFALGGPLGAGIGGVTGLIGDLATTWGHSGDAAKAAAAEQAAAVARQKMQAQQLLGVLESVNGAYRSQYKNAVIQQLQHLKGGGNAFTNAGTLGLNYQTVVNASLGQKSALEKIAATYDKLWLHAKEPTAVQSSDATWVKDQKAKLLAILNLRKELAEVAPTAASAEKQFEQFRLAQGRSFVASNDLGTSLGKLRKAFAQTGTSLDANSAYGQRNIAIIGNEVAAIRKQAQTELDHGKSIRSVNQMVLAQAGALITNMSAIRFNRGELTKLIQTMHLTPKSITTTVNTKTGRAKQTLNEIITKLDRISRGANGVVAITTTAGKTKSTGHFTPYASGGSVRDGWFTVGEEGGPRGFELGHKSGSNVQIFSNKKSRAMTGMGRVPGYASGTTPGISTTTVGGDKKWVYDGIKYASLSAAQNAQHRAATNTSAIGSAIESIGSAAGSKFYVKDVGITRIMTQIGKAFSVLEAQIGRGLKAKAAKPFEDELNRYLKLAQKQLTNLRAKINGQDLATLKKSLTGTAAGASAAFSSLIKDARNAGFSTATLDRLIAQQKKLTAVMRERAQVTSKLTAAQQVSSGVQSSFTGFFDVTSAGGTTDSNGNAVAPTFGSLFAAIKQAANQSKRFVSVVKKLAKEGLSRVLVAQLAQAGPAALPQALALASATPKQLAQFNSQSKIITTSGTTLGDFTAGLTAKTKTGGYANGVAAAQGYINGLKSQKKHLTNETEKIFNEAGKVVGKATKQEVVLSAKTIAELKAAFKDALSDVDLGVELDGKKVERASKKAQHRLARLG